MSFAKLTWLNSISFKILLAYVVGAALTIVLVSLLTFSLFTYKTDWLTSQDVANFAEKMGEELKFDQQGNIVGFIKHGDQLNWIFESLSDESAYRILDQNGLVVIASGGSQVFNSMPQNKEPLSTSKFIFKGLAFYSATSFINHNGKVWTVQFAVSERFHNLMHKGFALPFMAIGVILFSSVMLFVFGACAYFTLRRTLKPLRDISESAATISPRSINARLSSQGVPAEIAPLVESFNQALARLENGYKIQREFLATAAHELKTPLALIRAQIEVNGDSDEQTALLNDVQHMSRQVQQLLLLAEVSEEQNFFLSSVDIIKTSQEVETYLQPMAKSANVKVSINHPSEIKWLADSSALFVLLKNLLENAIQHAPSDTLISIDLTDTAINIRDYGPGVSKELLSKIFERFWKGAHRRDHGAGLGLSICKEIAQKHGWVLTAHKANPGLCFRLENLDNLSGELI